MSIYQRGENWYIDFTFKGQRIRESIGPSRKGAEKVMAKKKAEIAENKFLDVRKDPDPIEFYDFAKKYLQWNKANKKLSSYHRDLCAMRIFDRDLGGKTIQEITTWQIEKYKMKRSEKLKPTSVNREIAVLKHMFSRERVAGDDGRARVHRCPCFLRLTIKMERAAGVTPEIREAWPRE